jgi:hypothetical protein
MDEKRFVKTYSQGNGLSTRMEIWVDMKTGVNYIFTQSGYAGGMIPLLDAQGKPIVTPPSQLRWG